MPDRIKSLVYLNACVPENGKALVDYFPDSGKAFREQAAASGEGWLIPPVPASEILDNPEDAPWVDNQTTMQPLTTFEAAARLTGACDSVPIIGYVWAKGWGEQFQQFYDAAGERQWWRERFNCGHDIMLDMPEELSALLMARA
jgi:hypothetical protein